MRVGCYYYITESNKSPVREFIDSLDITTQKKFFFVKNLLEEFGHRLPFPHAKYIGDSIFELRFQGREGFYISFFIKTKQFLLMVLLRSLTRLLKMKLLLQLKEEVYF